MMSQVLHHRPMIYGSNRSVVRMIATRLPIDTGQRVYIQLPHGTGSHPSSPLNSMGGILDLTPEDGTLATLIRDPGLIFSKVTQRFRLEPIVEEQVKENENESESGKDKKATQERIVSLEAELARLKSQIAQYTLTQMEDNEVLPPPPPPPAPPPPPPLPQSTSAELVGATSSIDAPAAPNTSTPYQSNMSNVLQQIGSVKLRTLDMEKSLGGTPLRPKVHRQQEPSMEDPAAIIAHALRKKFSHKIFQDSPDKENLDRSESSFNEFNSPGPSTKLFD